MTEDLSKNNEESQKLCGGSVGGKRVREGEVWIMDSSSEKGVGSRGPSLSHQPCGASGSGWDTSLATHSH